jgi:hypothetical protein
LVEIDGKHSDYIQYNNNKSYKSIFKFSNDEMLTKDDCPKQGKIVIAPIFYDYIWGKNNMEKVDSSYIIRPC